jgi:antitoxin component of MazEF toxin-antitoxin module
VDVKFGQISLPVQAEDLKERIMIHKVVKASSSQTVSLPAELLEALHLNEGEEVNVELDAVQGRIIVASLSAPNSGIDTEFARQVAEFIERYRPALEALAR